MSDASDPCHLSSARTGRGQILLVEDNALVARTLAAVLEDAGYTIRCLADGESAWEFLESDSSRDLQAMVCDLGLPGISGRELLRRTAAQRSSLPIVVVSGYSEPQLHRELLANGAHSVVVKPIDSHELVAAVRAAVGA
jgi:CheY-like chemotaxis protein